MKGEAHRGTWENDKAASEWLESHAKAVVKSRDSIQMEIFGHLKSPLKSSLIKQEWICSIGKVKRLFKGLFSRDQIFPSESGPRTKNKAALQPSSSVVVENLRVLRRDSAIQRFKSLLDQSPGMDWIFC